MKSYKQGHLKAKGAIYHLKSLTFPLRNTGVCPLKRQGFKQTCLGESNRQLKAGTPETFLKG